MGANGASWNFYTYDCIREAYLTPGTYKFTITSPGYASQTFSVVVSPGQSGVGQNIYLEQSNTPVPEFNAIAVVAFSTEQGRESAHELSYFSSRYFQESREAIGRIRLRQLLSRGEERLHRTWERITDA